MSQTTRRYLVALAVVLLLGGAGEYLRVTRARASHYQPDFSAVPRRIGEFQGTDLPVDQSIFDFLSAGGMLEREYQGPGGRVRLSIIYAADWRSVHSPMGCYPAQGWEILDERPVTLAAPAATGGEEKLQARLLRVRKQDQERLAVFSFAYKGGNTADWATLPFRIMLGPPGAGGLVFTLSTSATPDAEAALQRLAEIFAAAYPPAVAFWEQSSPPPREPAVHSGGDRPASAGPAWPAPAQTLRYPDSTR